MFVGIWIHLSFVGRARRTARSALGLLYNIRRFFILRQWFKCEHFANCPPPGQRPFLFYRLLTADLPPIQRCAAGGGFTPSEGVAEWPPSAAGGCRAHGGGKRGQDTKHGFRSPLDFPYLPLSRRIEDARLNGGYGGSVPGVFQLTGRCIALNLLCVIRRA